MLTVAFIAKRIFCEVYKTRDRIDVRVWRGKKQGSLQILG